MIEEWLDGLLALVGVGLSLLAGGIIGGLIWGFVVVLPAELLFDARWTEDYMTHAAVIGAGTIGVRTIGTLMVLKVRR